MAYIGDPEYEIDNVPFPEPLSIPIDIPVEEDIPEEWVPALVPITPDGGEGWSPEEEDNWRDL